MKGMKKTLAIIMLTTMLLSSCGLNKLTNSTPPPSDNLKNAIPIPKAKQGWYDWGCEKIGDVLRSKYTKYGLPAITAVGILTYAGYRGYKYLKGTPDKQNQKLPQPPKDQKGGKPKSDLKNSKGSDDQKSSTHEKEQKTDQSEEGSDAQYSHQSNRSQGSESDKNDEAKEEKNQETEEEPFVYNFELPIEENNNL
jgi:hypothetical protein